MPVNPGVYNGGAPIRGLVSLPAPATTEMLTVDAAGNMSRQSIPTSSDKLPLSGGTLTGPLVLPAGSKSAVSLRLGGTDVGTGLWGSAGGTTPGMGFAVNGVSFLQTGDSSDGLRLHSLWGLAWTSGAADGTVEQKIYRTSSTALGFFQSGALRAVIDNGEITATGSLRLTAFNPATPDISILRNATGPTLETRSAGGLRVRVADGSHSGSKINVQRWDSSDVTPTYIQHDYNGMTLYGCTSPVSILDCSNQGWRVRSSISTKFRNENNTAGGVVELGEVRSDRAGSLSHVNPQNNIVLYGGFSGYGIGFDGNGELGAVVNSTLRSRLGQHLGLGSAGQIRFNSSADTSGSWDTLILRNATGPTLETRSTNGLKVCNADGSDIAQLEAKSILFNSQVRDQYGIGFRSQAGYMTFYGFNTVGSNSPTMSVDTAGVRVVGKTIIGAANYSEAFGGEALKVGGTGIVSAFGTDPAVVQVGSRGDSAPSVNAFLGGYSAAAGHVSTIYYGQNLYYDGTNWIHPYVAGRSSLFYQQNGAFYWNTHAGNAATGVGTERMSLNNSGTLTVNGTVNANNVRCQTGGGGIMGTRYINNGNDTWSAFEFPQNQNALTFSPGATGGLFRFEGTTSSHVALKRNGTTLQVRLGDDSAAAPIDAGANSKIGDWSFGWFGIRASNGSGVGIGNSTGEFQIYNSYNNQVFNTLSVADSSTSNRVYLNNTTEWRDPSAALATRATLNCNTGAFSCGAITANGAGGQVVNIVRAGFTNFGLGDKDGNSFRVYNNNTNTDLLVINATTRAIDCGSITSTGNMFLTGTFPYYGIQPSAWAGDSFYFQAGVDNNAVGSGNFTTFVNGTTRSFSFVSGNPTTTGRRHLTIDAATSDAVFGGAVTIGSNSTIDGTGLATLRSMQFGFIPTTQGATRGALNGASTATYFGSSVSNNVILGAASRADLTIDGATGAITATGRISSNNSDSFRLNAASTTTGGLIAAGTTGFLPVQIGGGAYNSNGLLVVGDGSYLGIRNTGGLYWVTSTNPLSNAAQTGIISPIAGLVEINNGTAGQTRDLSCRAITASGVVEVPAGTSSAPGLKVGSSSQTGLHWSTNALNFVVNGAVRAWVDANSVMQMNAAQLQGSGSYIQFFGGAFLYSGVSNTLEQYNGGSLTSAQTYRLYNTRPSSTNFESLQSQWDTNEARIGTNVGSAGGTQRNLVLGHWNSAGTWARRLTCLPDGSNLTLTSDIVTLESIGGGSFVRYGFGSWYASNNAIHLGSSGSRWGTLFSSAINTTGNVTLADSSNLILGTTTGTKIGTATTQRIGFFNATPVVQPSAVADATDAASVITQLNALLSRMRDLGLIAA